MSSLALCLDNIPMPHFLTLLRDNQGNEIKCKCSKNGTVAITAQKVYIFWCKKCPFNYNVAVNHSIIRVNNDN